MKKLTAKQEETLELARTVQIEGKSINMEWHWLRCDTGRTVNAGTVKALERAGKISIAYYSGGNAGVTVL